MNTKSVRLLSRHAITVLAPLMLLGACATGPYERGPVERPAPELAGTHWTVTSIDGRGTMPADVLTADFGVDGRVNGESGCNRFSGPFVQTGATVNFGELLSTRRDCVEDSRQRQEDRMLSVMHGATSVQLVRDELRLRGPSGSITLIPSERVDAAYVVTTTAPPSAPRRVQYDCQGIVISVEYGNTVARLTWPDGYDELTRRTPDGDVVSYQSAHSELRFGRDMLWGQQNGPTRTCFERR